MGAVIKVIDQSMCQSLNTLDTRACDVSTGSNLSEIRMVEESQSMKDACKVMLEPLTESGRARVGFGTSLLEEARAAGRGE